MHSVTDRRAAGQDYANSRSYCVDFTDNHYYMYYYYY